MPKKVKKKISYGHRLGTPDMYPPELRKLIPEFSLSGIQGKILDVLTDDLEGIATLSEIIVALYEKFNVLNIPRIEIMNEIYKLMRKGLVQHIKGKKGIYKIPSFELNGKTITKQSPNQLPSYHQT